MALSFDKALGIHADALQVRSRRLELLASNLANADTPNYKARDIDFRAALGHAQQGEAVAMRRTHAGHLPSGGAAGHAVEPQYRVPSQPSLGRKYRRHPAGTGRFLRERGPVSGQPGFSQQPLPGSADRAAGGVSADE